MPKLATDGKFALELFTLGRFAMLRDVKPTLELSKMLAYGPETIKPLPSKPRNRGNVMASKYTSDIRTLESAAKENFPTRNDQYYFDRYENQ